MSGFGYCQVLCILHWMVVWWGLSACVVPPNLEENALLGTSPPEFLSGIQPTEPFTLVEGTAQEFSVRIWDPDPETITIRVFLDGVYDDPIPIVSGPSFAPWQGNPRRSFEFDLAGLCDELIDFALDTPHVIELYAVDTAFDPNREEKRFAVPPGGYTSHLWRYQCEPAPAS